MDKVSSYIQKKDQWKEELNLLRTVLLKTKLEETIKWGAPFYTYKGKNVVGMSAFKRYFGLWFVQGALLQDSDKVLINAQEGKTNAMRQWRMQKAQDIDPKLITAYLQEAIKHIDEGHEIKPQKKALEMPPELSEVLGNDKALNEKFQLFTPGKQKEFANYIAEAKRITTKEKRLEKIVPMIQSGIGLNDKYR